MRVAIVTRGYPLDIYGGADVHVDFLVQELRARRRWPGHQPDRAAVLGKAGREHAVRQFGWDAVARRTVEVYASVRR